PGSCSSCALPPLEARQLGDERRMSRAQPLEGAPSRPRITARADLLEPPNVFRERYRTDIRGAGLELVAGRARRRHLATANRGLQLTESRSRADAEELDASRVEIGPAGSPRAAQPHDGSPVDLRKVFGRRTRLYVF